MTNVQAQSQSSGGKPDFDAVIIGAGFSGMYMLHSLRDKLELNVTVFEAGDGVGAKVRKPITLTQHRDEFWREQFSKGWLMAV